MLYRSSGYGPDNAGKKMFISKGTHPPANEKV